MFTRFRKLKMTVLFVTIFALFSSYMYLFVGEIKNQELEKLDKTASLAIQDFYQEAYCSTSSVMYQNSSKFFDFKIEPVTISRNNEGYLINYQLSVFNKSGRDFKNAYVVLGLDQQMGQYLATDVVEYPGARIDLWSINSNATNQKGDFAYRIDASYQLSLKEDLGTLSLADLYSSLESAKKIDISVYWDKGSESHSFLTRME